MDTKNTKRTKNPTATSKEPEHQGTVHVPGIIT